MTGNPGLDKILMGLNALVVGGAAALVIYAHTMLKPAATDQTKEFTDMVRDSMVEFKKQAVSFDEMVVNLYSRERRLRFLNLKMDIEVFEDGQQETINTMKPIIVDSLIDITGNMRPDELNSVTGKILLEARVKNKVNAIAGKKIVKRIYFSKFIIQ